MLSPLVTPDINSALTKPLEIEEVRIAAFSMPKLKAPGPDGFSGAFYHNHWSTIQEDVFKAVQQFFANSQLLSTFNRTKLYLIPKIKCPKSFSDFRPISCCNYLYKIISKILANRLKPWLPQLISDNQTGFVSGRCI